VASPDNLRRTVLHSAHVALGAKLAPFGGWEMPVVYSSIVEEHQAVRQRVGLFDVSHMGELIVSGFRAEAFLNRVLTNDVGRCKAGRAQYTFLCDERGGVLDDLVLYWLEPMRFLLLVNAANTYRDFGWLTEQAAGSVRVENHSDEIATLALQGPLAVKLLPMAAGLGLFQIGAFDVAGCRCWVSRTGYTGEDGFEVFSSPDDAPKLWRAFLDCGAEYGIRPCGLGARDTLRLEMCYPLHGQDITGSTTPLEAGLGRFVALDKPDFIGRTALLAQKTRGLTRKLVPFKMTDKSPPPRAHYPMLTGGKAIGEVTSGAPSPSLGIGIGMGYVEAALAAPGTVLGIEIRGKTFPAVVETKPLWKKTK
jgi:aminomethyltransferase